MIGVITAVPVAVILGTGPTSAVPAPVDPDPVVLQVGAPSAQDSPSLTSDEPGCAVGGRTAVRCVPRVRVPARVPASAARALAMELAAPAVPVGPATQSGADVGSAAAAGQAPGPAQHALVADLSR